MASEFTTHNLTKIVLFRIRQACQLMNEHAQNRVIELMKNRLWNHPTHGNMVIVKKSLRVLRRRQVQGQINSNACGIIYQHRSARHRLVANTFVDILMKNKIFLRL